MSQIPRSTSNAVNLRGTKENLPPQGIESNRQRSARQRLPTEKVATVRAEEAAAAERREAAKARKIQRTRQALEDDEDGGNGSQIDNLMAPTNFLTHTVAAKPLLLKTKALANRDRQAPAPAAHEHENRGLYSVPLQARATHEHGNNRGQSQARSHHIIDEDDEAHSHQNTYDEDKAQHTYDEAQTIYEDGEPVDVGAQSDNSDLEDEANNLDSMEDLSYNKVSRGPSCTPSSGDASLKRRASSCESLKETKIQRTSSGRPKAADYDDSEKALILSAISHYRAELGTVTAFPDIAKEAEMLGRAWQDACGRLHITAPITPRIAKLITSRGSQLRGELKSKTRPLVEGFFAFESGLNRKRIAKNRDTAENLKDGKGFIYKVMDADAMKRKGMYQAKILQKIINVMWFRNKQDEGIVHAAKFNPLTISALALVLTAIECCIDEWITGIKTDIPFSTALYKDVYEDHIHCLGRFNKITKQLILPNILLKLYNRGRFHAGAQPISTAGIPTISDSAFQAALKEYEEDSETETDGEDGETD